MRADAVLLCMAVLATGCASLTPSRGRSLSYTPRVATGPALVQLPNDEHPGAPAALPPSGPGSEDPERLGRRRGSRKVATGASPGSVAGAVGGRGQSASVVRDAVLAAVDDVKDSTDNVASALSKLAARPPTTFGNQGLTGANGVFTRNLDYGSSQLPWLRGALGSITTRVAAAENVSDSDMGLGILRMTGPRLQAAMFGAMLLAAWLDFLTLADVVLRECPAYSVEKLVADMHRVQRLIEPTMASLASGDPERVEAAALAMSELMGQLSREFGSIRDGARRAMENYGKTMAVVQFVEMFTMVSAMRYSLPRLPPAAPATIGVGLVMGAGGRLVRAGVISLPAISAAVRIHGGQEPRRNEFFFRRDQPP